MALEAPSCPSRSTARKTRSGLNHVNRRFSTSRRIEEALLYSMFIETLSRAAQYRALRGGQSGDVPQRFDRPPGVLTSEADDIRIKSRERLRRQMLLVNIVSEGMTVLLTILTAIDFDLIS